MKNSSKITLAGLAMLFASVMIQAAPVSENWENLCTKCHGADGKGETKIGKKLKLRDYTDAAVQAKMTDEEITKAITNGITDGGKEKMKAFGADLTKDEVKALVSHIRKFKS